LKKNTETPRTKAHITEVAIPAKVKIRQLPSGVRGLDNILGGGIPEFSFNIIAGTPGCGKTTLAHQIVFANATVDKPALYFTVLGEPALKMLRYQQQYAFFDGSKLGSAIRFMNLAETLLEKDLDAVFDEITQNVAKYSPAFVVVDSFRTVVRVAAKGGNESQLQSFIQRLAQFLTSWQATTFLVGEYVPEEVRDNPIFTIADGLLWLSQVPERNSVVRKLQIMKLRGQASVPGLHTFRISESGLQTFSRNIGFAGNKVSPPRTGKRLSIGIPALDAMMGGGLFEGDSLLVAGPSGTGKSALATHFIAEGIRQGEPGIMALFEERPSGYATRADNFKLGLTASEAKGKLELLYLRPLDLSVDETMQEILDAIERIGAKRLVIDSLVGFEMALAPGFRADFRESLYRMIIALTGAGVTILSTVEVEDTFTGMAFSHYAISFLTDDIIRMRYVEIDGQLRKVIMVIKMRGGNHSKDIREYVISEDGMTLIQPRSTDYEGLTTGIPRRTGPRTAQPQEASPEPKTKVSPTPPKKKAAAKPRP
jgi:circadian clock protein KaiC